MLTLGCDPEVFSSVEINNKPFVISPALLEKFSGLKPITDERDIEEQIKHPFYIKEKGYNWMMDGVAWESTYKKPFFTPKDMYETIGESLSTLDDFIDKYEWLGAKLKIFKRPAININPKIYLPLLDDDKILQGFIFGCDADFDAIDLSYDCDILDVETHEFRYGGGHIHIGATDSDEREVIHKFIIPFIQLLAITVGNICLARSDYIEDEKKRTFHYGNPGRFRPQKWGCEYRSPSNSWIQNLDTIEMIFNGCERAFYLLNNPKEGKKVVDEFLNLTVTSIKTSDKSLASEIISEVM